MPSAFFTHPKSFDHWQTFSPHMSWLGVAIELLEANVTPYCRFAAHCAFVV